MAAQAGLCLAWLETPKDTFCHDEAQMDSANKAVMKMGVWLTLNREIGGAEAGNQ